MELENKLSGFRFEFAFDKKLLPFNKAIVAAIIVVSVAVRIVYFSEITQSPAGHAHRTVQSDMHLFHVWAKKIAAGDLLTDQVLHPLNLWHTELAAEYFRIRPDVEKALIEKGVENPALALWNFWYGGKRFHQEPAYPYLVAATYMLAGEDVRAVFVWQMLLGVFTNLLAYLIARRFFGETVALLTACFTVLYAPLLFYEATLLRSTLITFVSLAIVAMSDEAFRRDSKSFWFLAGLLFGFAVLVKMSMVLINLSVVMVMVLYEKDLRKLLRNTSFLCLGGMLALSPAIARNLAVGTGPAELSSVGAITFACTNTVDYSPDIEETFPCSKKYVPGIMGGTRGNFPKAILATLKTHDSLTSYMSLILKKFVSIWTWEEKPNNVNFYFARLHSNTLKYLPIGFSWIGPLATIGLLLGVFRFRRLALLYAPVAATIVPLTAFYAISRFRSPLTALLIPFAAFSLVWIVSYVRTRPVAGGILMAMILLPPVMFHVKHEPRYIDHLSAWQYYYEPMLNEAKGDDGKCRGLFREVLRFEPDMGVDNPPKSENEFDTARFFHHIRRKYADYLTSQGAEKEAGIQKRRADAIKAGAMKFREIPAPAGK